MGASKVEATSVVALIVETISVEASLCVFFSVVSLIEETNSRDSISGGFCIGDSISGGF